jgi:hypothetical protein
MKKKVVSYFSPQLYPLTDIFYKSISIGYQVKSHSRQAFTSPSCFFFKFVSKNQQVKILFLFPKMTVNTKL